MGFYSAPSGAQGFFSLRDTLKYGGDPAKTRPRSNCANIYLHVLSMTHTEYTRYFRKKRRAARTCRPITGILVQFLKCHIMVDIKKKLDK